MCHERGGRVEAVEVEVEVEESVPRLMHTPSLRSLRLARDLSSLAVGHNSIYVVLQSEGNL